VNGLVEFLKGAGATRLALIIGVTGGVVVALAMIMARAGGAGDALLYGGLDPRDASEVAGQLDAAGIGYRLGDGGGSIYVSRDDVANARLLVASEGALGSGSVGYEIFDETDALGTTQFIQNVNAKRATEGELARTLLSLRGVTSARVHLVLPERRLFERDAQEPTATVVVGLADPSAGASHAGTIRNLVATAVAGLSPMRVTVVDETGRTLANGAEDGEQASALALADRRAALEERLRRKALDAIEAIVGPGAARVQVSAEIDLNRITQNAERFDPDGQVVRSTQTVEESSQDQERDRNDGVSVANNLPGQPADAGGNELSASSSTDRVEETVNYEISRTTTTEVRESGAINRLSVAVVVDHARSVADDGTVTYEPREQAELDRIAALARAAVGYDSERGDIIEVTSLPFQRPDTGLGVAAAPGGLFSFSKNDIMRAAEIGVMLVIGLALVIMVARPLAKGLVAPPQPALAGAGVQAAIGEGSAQAEVTDQSRGDKALPAPEGGGADSGIDVQMVDGKLKDSSVKQLARVVESHPEESLSILRNWMNES